MQFRTEQKCAECKCPTSENKCARGKCAKFTISIALLDNSLHAATEDDALHLNESL